MLRVNEPRSDEDRGLFYSLAASVVAAKRRPLVAEPWTHRQPPATEARWPLPFHQVCQQHTDGTVTEVSAVDVGARIGGFTSGDTLILENLGGLAPTESETIGNGEATVAVSSGDVVTY